MLPMGTVQRDASNLKRLTNEEICQSLLDLREADYCKSGAIEKCKDGGKPFKVLYDAYLLPDPSPNDADSKIYIKLSLNSNWVSVHSFHLQR